ncbi:MAG TPA: hypothetical protein DCO75_11820 [Fibrobacteres bacterium]|nr:hypothetical protein [Fibrobacterota bacterium]
MIRFFKEIKSEQGEAWLHKTEEVLYKSLGGECGFGVHQVAERELQLYGWSKPRRVIVSRKLVNQESPQQSGTLLGICQYEYGAYVTDLAKTDGNTFQIVHLYNERCDCENIFNEQKNQWGLNGFCAKKGNVTEFAARMTMRKGNHAENVSVGSNLGENS